MAGIKQKIVATDTFQMVTARLHQRKMRHKLADEFSLVIEKYRALENACTATSQPSSYIWLCWWQGREQMSPLVRECCDRIERFNPDKQVVLITEENMAQYVSFPSYILEKYQKGIITKTHLSDLLRAELLAQYGGVWMDATIYTFGPIPEKFFRKTLYTGRCEFNKKDYNVSRNRWTSYFWVSPYPGHIFFCYLRDFWHSYWKDHNTLIEYFLIDYVIDLGVHNIPVIKRELDSVDINGCGTDLWLLLRKLPEDYSPELMSDVRQSNWMQKLSYKGEEFIQKKALHPEKSVYKTLFLDVQEI